MKILWTSWSKSKLEAGEAAGSLCRTRDEIQAEEMGSMVAQSFILPRTQKTLQNSICNKKHFIFMCWQLLVSLSCYTTTPSHRIPSRISDQLIPTPNLFITLCSSLFYFYILEDQVLGERAEVSEVLHHLISPLQAFLSQESFPIRNLGFPSHPLLSSSQT